MSDGTGRVNEIFPGGRDEMIAFMDDHWNEIVAVIESENPGMRIVTAVGDDGVERVHALRLVDGGDEAGVGGDDE